MYLTNVDARIIYKIKLLFLNLICSTGEKCNNMVNKSEKNKQIRPLKQTHYKATEKSKRKEQI